MKKTYISHLSFLALGAVVTAGVFMIDWHNDRSEAVQALAAGIAAGDFCTTNTGKDMETIKAEIEDIYFVGCGGFF